jgi:hypothetical protein
LVVVDSPSAALNATITAGTGLDAGELQSPLVFIREGAEIVGSSVNRR